MACCFVAGFALGSFRPCVIMRLLANRFCFGFWQVNVLDHATSRVSDRLICTYSSNAGDARA